MGFQIIRSPDIEVNLGIIGYALLALWLWAHRSSFIPDVSWEWLVELYKAFGESF